MTKAGGRALVLFALVLASCTSTKVRLSDKWNPDLSAAYEDYFDYYVFGFIGDPELNLQKICVDQKPYAVRRRKSAEDIIITVATLGMYSPVTVKVWCGD